MTNRSIFSKGCIKSSWKVLICLIMAFVLFFECPFESQAVVVIGEYFKCTGGSSSTNIPLISYSFADTPTPSSDYWIPVTYQGDFSLTYSVTQTAGKSYASGGFVVPVTTTYTIKNDDFRDVHINVDMTSFEAPDGITVTYKGIGGSAGTQSYQLIFQLENVFFYNIPSVTVNFSFECSGFVLGSTLLHSVSYIGLSTTSGSATLQGGRYYDYAYEYGSGASLNKMVVDACKLVVAQVAASGNYLGGISQKILDNMLPYTTIIKNQVRDSGNYIADTMKYYYQELINTFNANSQNQIDAANKNSQNEINTANKNADDIMHSYDSTGQQSDNDRFDQSQKQLQKTEDSLFSSALTGFGSLNLENYSFGKFTAMLEAFSFVSGFIQSLYVKMGDFGLIVTIGLVVMIAIKVIGLYRFSTGGDP